MNRTRTIVPDDLLAPATNGNGRKSADRDGHGRFKVGNGASKGHGRPIDGLRGAVAAAVTPEDLTAIVKAAVARARRGDARSREWLFDRIFGRARVADAAPVALEGLPKVAGVASAARALGVLVAKVAAGEISADEGRRVAGILGELRRLADGLEDPLEEVEFTDTCMQYI